MCLAFQCRLNGANVLVGTVLCSQLHPLKLATLLGIAGKTTAVVELILQEVARGNKVCAAVHVYGIASAACTSISSHPCMHHAILVWPMLPV